MHAADLLTKKTKASSPVCVGLDPQPGKLPEGIAKDAAGVELFCKGIIDAVKGVACSVKPNLAFFEVFGWEGMRAFWNVAEYAKKNDLVVIADAKRGDIGSTAEAYADAYLGPQSPVDFLTVNPFLGSDGIKPFMERGSKNGKGIFILVKTSNPSSGELQDLPSGDEAVHEHLSHLVEGWAMEDLGEESGLSSVGAVVGATYPEELKYLRSIMPHVPFLIPGYGAQGGTAADVKPGFIEGLGAVVNSSRGIIYASSGKDWKEAATKAAKKMAEELKF